MIPSDINPWLFVGYFLLVNLIGVAIGWTLRQIFVVRPKYSRRHRSPWFLNL